STPVRSARARASTAASSSRNAGSPSAAKISGMVRPSASTISVSRSAKSTPSWAARARPTLLLPAPIGPIRIARGPVTGRGPGGGGSLPLAELGSPQGGPGPGGRSPRRSSQQGVGQGERYDGLGDHRGRGDGAGVGALVVGGGLLAGGDVDGAQGARNGR